MDREKLILQEYKANSKTSAVEVLVYWYQVQMVVRLMRLLKLDLHPHQFHHLLLIVLGYDLCWFDLMI